MPRRYAIVSRPGSETSHTRRVTARTLQPFDPGAVAPWQLGSGSRGVLLLHGFAGTPPELRGLGEHLAPLGFRCRAPALAGHALSPGDLATTGWRDWLSSAEEELALLRTETAVTAVCGQSMGGTLALLLAARNPDVAAVATLAAPVHVRSAAAPLLPVMQHVVRWHYPRSEVDLYRREGVEELHSYGKRSTHAIHEFFQLLRHTADSLALVRQPVLLLHGARDSVVDQSNVGRIARRLVSAHAVETHLYPRSGHALSVDVDREDAFARVASWFERWLPAGA